MKKKTNATKKKHNAKKAPALNLIKTLKKGVSLATEQIEGIFEPTAKDIVEAVKKDHKALRRFLDLLKNTDESMTDRRRAYENFAALLKSHTIAEEKAVYVPTMALAGREMHIKTAEGYVEHQLSEDLMRRLESAKTSLEWSAHANVLSEIIEHHLREEERDLLPLIRKAANVKQNMDMLVEYNSLRARTQKKVTKKNAGVLEELRN